MLCNNSESCSTSPATGDIGIQYCFDPITLKSVLIQTEFKDVATCTNVSVKTSSEVPPSVNANLNGVCISVTSNVSREVTRPADVNGISKVLLPENANITSVVPLSKPAIIIAEEWKVKNYHIYEMQAPPFAGFSTNEDDSFNATSLLPMPEVEVVVPPLVRKKMGVMKVMMMIITMMKSMTQIGNY